MLNLREPPPEESASSSSPSEDTREVEAVQSVRRLLESRQPPGLASIRRFVLKPRPRLWSFGVGVWLWLVKLAEWFVDFLRWLGRGSGRVVKALGLAGFTGRRMQNLGARVGYWGRNWSTAEGRLGRLGVRCVAFGQRLVTWGAAIAALSGGAADFTKRAAQFIAEVMDDPALAPSPDRTPDGGGPAPDPPPPAARREAPAPSAPDPVRTARPAASPPPPESKPPPASKPRPASKPSSRRTRPPESPPKPAPAPAPITPLPPLPDDIPEYMQIELRAIRQTSRPLPESVRRLILEVTGARGWTRPADLAVWLGFDTNYLNRRYLAPMTKAGLLERRYPKSRHPRQTYRAARPTGPDAVLEP